MRNKWINFIFILAMLVVLFGIIVIIIMPNPIFPAKPTYTPVVSITLTSSPQIPTSTPTPTSTISPTLIIVTPTKPELTWEPTIVIPTLTPTPIVYTPVPSLPTIEYAVIKECKPKFWYQVCYIRCCPLINEK